MEFKKDAETGLEADRETRDRQSIRADPDAGLFGGALGARHSLPEGRAGRILPNLEGLSARLRAADNQHRS